MGGSIIRKTMRVLVVLAAVFAVMPQQASAQDYVPGTDAQCARTLNAEGEPQAVFFQGEEIIVESFAGQELVQCHAPGTEVTVEIRSHPIVIGKGFADAEGNFSSADLKFIVPKDMEPGTHSVVVSCIGPDGEVVSYSNLITVRAAGAIGGLPATGAMILRIVIVAVVAIGAGWLLIIGARSLRRRGEPDVPPAPERERVGQP